MKENKKHKNAWEEVILLIEMPTIWEEKSKQPYVYKCFGLIRKTNKNNKFWNLKGLKMLIGSLWNEFNSKIQKYLKWYFHAIAIFLFDFETIIVERDLS